MCIPRISFGPLVFPMVSAVLIASRNTLDRFVGSPLSILLRNCVCVCCNKRITDDFEMKIFYDFFVNKKKNVTAMT